MSIVNFYDGLTARLRSAGDWIWPLALRLILAWEFWESGIEKYHGNNWFGSLLEDDKFPWPFSAMSADLNWFFATWGEMVFAVMLLLGLFTRFTAFSLIVITAVATAAVHWPMEYEGLGELWKGYEISAKGGFGNYKLPLLFIIMLLPLVFHGGGKLSLDHLFLVVSGRRDRLDDRTADWQSLGLGLFVLAFSVVWMEPAWGLTLLVASAIALTAPQFLDQPR
jgi:putative oxidoreductase